MKVYKTKRIYMTFTAVLFLTSLLASPVMAVSQTAGKGKQTATVGVDREHGSWRGKGIYNLSAEQREQIRNLHQKFRADNADTIKQLMAKHFDLRTTLNSDKPDFEKAKAVQKEINDLNAKLAQKRIDLYSEIRKINPDAKFGEGPGRGLRMGRRMPSERMHEDMGT